VALSKIGASTIAIQSSSWWSSTEYNSARAWNLANGNTVSDIKVAGSGYVLPLFRL